jgi:hypothetical protein
MIKFPILKPGKNDKFKTPVKVSVSNKLERKVWELLNIEIFSISIGPLRAGFH